MKEKVRIFSIIIFLVIAIFSQDTYAIGLSTIDVQTSKTIVSPGEEVTVLVNFGEALSSYTVKIAYDDNIFDYVSSEGGTAVNTFDKIIMSYGDTDIPVDARPSVSVTFRAKSSLTTTNPTDFVVTADNLKNADSTVIYDPITTGVINNLTVEPEYEDYTIKLTNIDEVIKEKEIAMVLSYSSAMGRPYAHARLVAEVASDGGNVKLLGTDTLGVDHDIITEGWGAQEGYEIGGKGVTQELHVRAVFSEIGEYTITLKLIDKENSDMVISQRSFPFTVLDTPVASNYEIVPLTIEEAENEVDTPPVGRSIPVPEHTNTLSTNTPVTNTTNESTNVVTNSANDSVPKNLPKTGRNAYIYGIIALVVLTACYIYYNKK